jgi:hypothetical protein
MMFLLGYMAAPPTITVFSAIFAATGDIARPPNATASSVDRNANLNLDMNSSL